MKYLTLASLILPLTSSMPTSSDLQIRNPQEIARLVSINNDIHERLLNGQVVSLDKRGDVQLDKRIIQVAGLAGVALIEAIGAGVDITAGLAGNLLSIFTGDDQDQIWKNHGHCRVNFQTDDGSICDLKSYARDSADATGDHHWAGLDNCAWVNPESTAPGIKFFEGEKGIGKYSIQYTATDSVAWSGTPNTKKCPFEGLCNPQIVFYRKDYSIVLDTWISQGEISKCQYSHGEDCAGLCSSGVKDQFSANGIKWGGDCAVPCEDDANLPESK